MPLLHLSYWDAAKNYGQDAKRMKSNDTSVFVRTIIVISQTISFFITISQLDHQWQVDHQVRFLRESALLGRNRLKFSPSVSQ
jgi:hypothetical protein